MGVLGQGSRAVAGLKSMSDDAKILGVQPSDLFQAARLFVSLAIGFLVGLAAALIYLMSSPTSSPDWHILLGFAAAGYAGTDFIEAFTSRYLTPAIPRLAPSTGSLVGLMTKPAGILSNAASLTTKAAPAPTTAKALVYSVMNQLAPNQSIQDTTTLESLGYDDPPSKDVIRGKINSYHWHGVNLPFNALAKCDVVSDITDIVTKATPS